MCFSGNPDLDSSRGKRCGYVALVGRPNAGKSTLMNALVGERISIVTPKAQTTWQRVTGIATTDRAQMVFLDTPGLLQPKDLLQRTMLSAALEALSEADVILLVLDGANPPDPADREVVARALSSGIHAPLLAAINKTDLASGSDIQELTEWVVRDFGGEAFPLSALTRQGVDSILSRLEEVLPPGPFLYPEDEIARDPVRFFVAEMVRETVFETYYQEIPYSVFCEVEEFREEQEPVYIQANIFVERNSQKRILIGKGGSSIRSMGARARRKMEEFLGRAVYLDLWVKVLPDWRRRRVHLKRLGFPVPDEATGNDPA
jgi:GTP-binding protein Era